MRIAYFLIVAEIQVDTLNNLRPPKKLFFLKIQISVPYFHQRTVRRAEEFHLLNHQIYCDYKVLLQTAPCEAVYILRILVRSDIPASLNGHRHEKCPHIFPGLCCPSSLDYLCLCSWNLFPWAQYPLNYFQGYFL